MGGEKQPILEDNYKDVARQNSRKFVAEFRMEIYDSLPARIRELINQEDATEAQMLCMLEQISRLERQQPPSEGRLYRVPRH